MQGQPEAFDAIVVGSGISGGLGGQGAHRARAARAAARARQERRARQGLRERPQGARGSTRIAAAARTRWKRRYPVLKRDYPLNEKNLDWWVEREGVALHRGQALRLVSRLPRRRPLADLGPPELSPERLRLRGERARKASPSTGRSATPTSRRGTTTSSATPASPARSKGCRSCPTASSSRRCRSTAARSSSPAACAKQFDGHAPHHPGPRRQPDAAARRAARRASTATPAGSAVRTAPTSARSRRRCRRRWRRAGSRSSRSRS